MPELILGIEGGGTKTTWAILDAAEPGSPVKASGQLGSGNVQLMAPDELKKKLAEIHLQTPLSSQLSAVCGAFAGCHLPVQQAFVEGVLRELWPNAKRVRAVGDTLSAMAAAFGGTGVGIIVIAGTGSNVVGCGAPGERLEKVAGWGHLFADRGSAYDFARSGLELAYEEFDVTGKISILAEEYLRLCEQKSMEEMVPFILGDLTKSVVASRASAVFSAAGRGHAGAFGLICDRADFLAGRVAIIAKRIGLAAPEVALTGGMFENQPVYFEQFQYSLGLHCPGARAFILTVPGCVGAARLVESGDKPSSVTQVNPPQQKDAKLNSLSLTEQRNPRSRGLDKKSVLELVDLFTTEEIWVHRALEQQRNEIISAATLVSDALCKGGRLFYLGAGTSGRLGVVDASEMPPTFNASPDEIQALIAGGPEAVFRSQEGAEDSQEAAAIELKKRGLRPGDIVCGIAASGHTPFVMGGLRFGKETGCKTVLITCNPFRNQLVPVDVAIDLPTGPELITGSTRLKAGTVTKLVLNMLSSIAMIRLGRVQDNLMVNVQATNEKLRGRAIRLVMTLTGCEETAATKALEQEAWRVPKAADRVRGIDAAPDKE